MRFQTKTVEIDAIQFTGTNYPDVAEWAGNTAEEERVRIVYRSGLPVALMAYGVNGAAQAVYPGAWIIKTPIGLTVVSDSSFTRDYEPVEDFHVEIEEPATTTPRTRR
jgi:hypothetical protein